MELYENITCFILQIFFCYILVAARGASRDIMLDDVNRFF